MPIQKKKMLQNWIMNKTDDKNNEESQVSINSLPVELMEKIFSYLTLKEAFRYETVCKKWQKIIFNKQEVIHLYDCLQIDYYSFTGFPKIPFYGSFKDWLQGVLKKCPNIKKIDSDDYCMKAKEIQVLMDFCPHLNDIEINYREDNEEDKDSFYRLIQKYGHQLKRVTFNKMDVNLIKQFCCSLREINCFNDTFRSGENVLDFRLLSKTYFYVDHQADADYFRSFTQSYCKQLKCLHLYIDTTDENIIKILLQEVTKYSRLHYLMIKSWTTLNDIKEQLMNIAKACIHLKQLEIVVNQRHVDSSFHLFSRFQALKELIIRSGSCSSDANLDNLSGCKHLQKLTLDFSHKYNKLLKDIHLFLPNLTFIHLYGIFFFDTTLKCLAQLKTLNTIILRSYSNWMNWITDIGVCHLLNSCCSIRTMIVEFKLNITHVSINKLISLASQNPGLRYTFIYTNDDENNMHGINSHENGDKKIPSNLYLGKFNRYFIDGFISKYYDKY